MGHPSSLENFSWGLGDPYPPRFLQRLDGRVASLTHKKKKKKWKEAEAGVVWKWELHMGDEVEAIQVQWYRRGSKAALVECAEWRWVYTIGISLVACRE